MRSLWIALLFLISPLSWASEYHQTLENGFTYSLHQIADSSDRIELRLIIKSGSLSEKENQRGYAHLLEHMAFNGTRHFPKKDILELFQQAGLGLGHGLNAFTYMDRTVYTLSIPSKDHQLFQQTIRYLGDILSGIEFDQAELDLEKGVVKSEYLARHRQEQPLLEALFEDHLKGSRFGERMPLGKMAVIEQASESSLKAYYRTWYRPDNARLLVVGNQDIQQTSQLIRQVFAGIQPGKTQPKQQIPASPNLDTHPTAYTSKVTTSSESWLFFAFPDLRLQDLGDMVASHQRDLLVMLLNNRLNNNNEQSKQPFSRINVIQLPTVGNQSMLAIHLLHRSDRYQDAARYLGEELARVVRYGFTEPELAMQLNTKSTEQANLPHRYANLTSAQLADNIEHALANGNMIQTLASEQAVYAAFFQQTELATINQQAKTMLAKQGKWVYAYPYGSSKPDINALQKAFTTASNGKVSPPEAGVVATSLSLDTTTLDPTTPDTNQATGQAITAQTTFEPFNITRWQLANGVTVLLQPDKAANGRVYIEMAAPGGVYGLSQTQIPALSVFQPAMLNSHLAGLSPQQLHQKLSAADVFLQPYIDSNAHGFYIESGTKGLETAFATLNALFTQIRIDNNSFTSIKTTLAEQQANALKLPAIQAQRKLLETLYPDNSYETLLSVEQIESVSRQNIDALARHFLASANGYQMTIVGDFKIDAIKALVESNIASLPSGARHEFASRKLPFISRSRSLTEHVNPQNRADLNFFYLFDKKDTSLDEIYAADLIGRIISQRLMDKIREELSLTYTPSAWCANSAPGLPYSSCNITITSSAQDARKTQQAVNALITKLVKEGISDKELAQHKTALALGMADSVKSIKDRHRFLHRDNMYGFPPGSIYRTKAIIDGIDSGYINQLLKVYFNSQHRMTFTSLPAS